MLNDQSFYFYFYLTILFPLSIGGNQDFNIINEETHLMRMLLNEKNYLKKVRPSIKIWANKKTCVSDQVQCYFVILNKTKERKAI
jgi:hypothetical protein